MVSLVSSFDPKGRQPKSEQEWHELLQKLQRKVSHYVNSWDVPYWAGKKADIVEDSTQEGILRSLIHAKKADQGLVPPILSFSALSTVASINYARDARRKDARLLCLPDIPESYMWTYQWVVDPSEIAIEAVILVPIFTEIARIISTIPCKQKRALLIDLAHLTHFDPQPTLIEMALSDVGIHLHEYYVPLSSDPRLRKQHSSNLSTAYSHLRAEARKQPSILEFVA